MSEEASHQTPSTVQLVDTQEIDDLGISPNEKNSQEEKVWGRLFAIGDIFQSLDLCKNIYTFGRDPSCDYLLDKKEMIFSNVHFKMTRCGSLNNNYTELEDTSSNGTFINGKKIGRGQKQVLLNNDEISLALPKLKAFIYMDTNSSDDLEIDEIVRERFTVSKVIGSGASGEVRIVFEKGTCRKFAMKTVSKSSVGFINSVGLMNEVKLLQDLDHPSIVKVEDVIDTQEKLFIILQLVEGGDLFDRIDKKKKLSETVSKLITYQLLTAIKYLHSKGIVHRDLKPENVLLWDFEDETLIKVADFGVSKCVDANTKLRTLVGTPNYLAPEIIKSDGNGNYTNVVDCWSIGIILFCCLVGYQPFTNDDSDKLYKDICSRECKFHPKHWKNISKEAIDLVKGLLKKEPEERLTVEEALNHSWLQDEHILKKARELMEDSNNCSTPENLKRDRDSESDMSSDISKSKRFAISS